MSPQSAQIAQIWRHPIKGIGAEQLDSTKVLENRPLPLDRAWAMLQEGGDASDGWRRCTNFIRGAKSAALMAITAEVEMASHALGPSDGTVLVTAPTTRIRLSHPDRPDILIDPAQDSARLVEWIKPIYPLSRPAPTGLVRAPAQGMADADYASISILNMASLRALGQRLGKTLDPRRFRGNLWVEGWAPWEEFDMVGKALLIGGIPFEVIEPITRCRATEANPETGRHDAEVLLTLEEGWKHQDFGVYAMAKGAGTLKTGAAVHVQ